MNLNNVSYNNTRPLMDVYQVPLGTINKIYNAFDTQYFSALIKNQPQIGKEAEQYFIINTNVLINNPYNIEHINIYNTLMQIAQHRSALLQLLKNQ